MVVYHVATSRELYIYEKSQQPSIFCAIQQLQATKKKLERINSKPLTSYRAGVPFLEVFILSYLGWPVPNNLLCSLTSLNVTYGLI